ncbi:MAG: hypothetical protein JW772_04850 [Candidatus Diapherotrites archaeon]|nr:hypothetical protein [Candidatus Diapherotrites archaeon]
MNAEGDAPINVITWIAIIVVVLMMLVWFMGSYVFSKPRIEAVKSDLINIREMIDEGCDTNSYYHKINPISETGALSVNDANICIHSLDVSFCENSICKTGMNVNIDLGQVTWLAVEKSTATGNKVIVHAE